MNHSTEMELSINITNTADIPVKNLHEAILLFICFLDLVITLSEPVAEMLFGLLCFLVFFEDLTNPTGTLLASKNF